MLIVALARRRRRRPRLQVATAAGAVGAALRQGPTSWSCSHAVRGAVVAHWCTLARHVSEARAGMVARASGAAAAVTGGGARHCPYKRRRRHRAPRLTATVPSKSFIAAVPRPGPQAALRATKVFGQAGTPGYRGRKVLRWMWAGWRGQRVAFGEGGRRAGGEQEGFSRGRQRRSRSPRSRIPAPSPCITAGRQPSRPHDEPQLPGQASCHCSAPSRRRRSPPFPCGRAAIAGPAPPASLCGRCAAPGSPTAAPVG